MLSQSAISNPQSAIHIDRPWQPSAVKLIKNNKAPVITVYFHGTTHRLFSLSSKVNPLQLSSGLPSKLKAHKNKTIKIRIGSPLTVKDQSSFGDLSHYSHYLRARTKALGSPYEKGRKGKLGVSRNVLTAEPLANPVSSDLLTEEYKRIRSEYELFATGNYSVVFAPVDKIPWIFREIGRLRKRTFKLHLSKNRVHC